MEKKCLIMMSGGLDSTTIVALAKSQNYKIHGINFDYDQRHKYEIICAKKVAQIYDVELKTINLDLRSIGGSSLTDSNIEVAQYENFSDLPKDHTLTYVPARNTIFLSYALSYAETIGVYDIFCGANKSDYHNYPDCRKEFFDAFATLANLGTKAAYGGEQFKIHTPLIELEKEDIIKMGNNLGVNYENTISCYQPTSDGLSCGKCMSCIIRKEHFKKAGLQDPTRYC